MTNPLLEHAGQADPNDQPNGATTNPASEIRPSPWAQRLRELFANKSDVSIGIGVYDGLTARIAIGHGCHALHVSPLPVSASRRGEPDLHPDMPRALIETVSMITSLTPSVAE
ncbi:hypothetical protein BJY04DRAFT_217456 [Aspergillus karnatakaensis]|uniref:uncharacterized protein n=1 Tax=Aspergillus karnatakaensis TaxID=1810916 RepID=UPI003CCE0EBF